MDKNWVTISGAIGRIQPSTCGSPPTPSLKRKMPSAETKKLVSEIGLRYQPASRTDLAAHAAQLALLARDLADVDTDDLADAIQAHVLACPFMPKAADLIDIIEQRDRNYHSGYVSESGYIYRGRTPEDVMREAERRADWTTYYSVKAKTGNRYGEG